MTTPTPMTETVLGRTFRGTLTADQIEVWQLPRKVFVEYTSEEFLAKCPVTGQPDLYRIAIRYHSDHTFESKGLKLYLWSFRDLGIGCEALALRIADELSVQLHDDVEVELLQAVRGGLKLSAMAHSVQEEQ